MDDGTEIGGHGVARTTDVEFLLHEEFRLERHIGLGIADADDTSGKGHLVDGHLIGRCAAHGFYHHVGTETAGYLQQTGMDILGLAVEGVGYPHAACQGEFFVVYVGSHDRGSPEHRAHDGSHTHHTATNDQHHVNIRHLCSRHGMETDTHRFH